MAQVDLRTIEEARAWHASRWTRPGLAQIEAAARMFCDPDDVAARKRRVASSIAALRRIAASIPRPARPPEASWHRADLRGDIGGAITAARVRRILADAGRRHVLLNLTTPGGNLAEADDIVAEIEGHRPGVTTRAQNWCASAGVLVLAAGRYREAAAGTRIALHDCGVADPPLPKKQHTTASLFRQYAERLDRLDRRYVNYLSRRTGIPQGVVRVMKAAEKVLTPEEAKRHKLIDAIVSPPRGQGGWR